MKSFFPGHFFTGFEKQAAAEVDKSGMRPQIVIFEAGWSEPAKAYKRKVGRVQARYPRVPVTYFDMEEDRALANILKIKTIPHTLLVRRNEVLDQASGDLSEEEIAKLFQRAQGV